MLKATKRSDRMIPTCAMSVIPMSSPEGMSVGEDDFGSTDADDNTAGDVSLLDASDPMASANQEILEEADSDYEPTHGEVVEYARWLGIRPEEDAMMLWIAREGLAASLPENWKPCRTGDGQVYYFNFTTGESDWDHPSDAHFRDRVREERMKRVTRPDASVTINNGSKSFESFGTAGGSLRAPRDGAPNAAKVALDRTSASTAPSSRRSSGAFSNVEGSPRPPITRGTPSPRPVGEPVRDSFRAASFARAPVNGTPKRKPLTVLDSNVEKKVFGHRAGSPAGHLKSEGTPIEALDDSSTSNVSSRGRGRRGRLSMLPERITVDAPDDARKTKDASSAENKATRDNNSLTAVASRHAYITHKRTDVSFPSLVLDEDGDVSIVEELEPGPGSEAVGTVSRSADLSAPLRLALKYEEDRNAVVATRSGSNVLALLSKSMTTTTSDKAVVMSALLASDEDRDEDAVRPFQTSTSNSGIPVRASPSSLHSRESKHAALIEAEATCEGEHFAQNAAEAEMRVARHESTAPHHQLVDDQEGEYTLRISDAASPTVGPNLEHRVLQAERRAADAERRAADAEARTAIADAELSRLNRDLAMARVELAERMNAETATSATIEAVREMASTRDALVAVFDRSAERHDAAMASARSRFERTARNLVMRAERAVASADAAARASETAALNIREAVSSSLHTPSRRSTRASDFGRSLRDVVEHATCPSPTSPSSAVSPSSTASPAPSLTASKMESLTDVSSSSAGNGQPEPVCSTSKFSPRSPPTGEKSHASDSSSDGGRVRIRGRNLKAQPPKNDPPAVSSRSSIVDLGASFGSGSSSVAPRSGSGGGPRSRRLVEGNARSSARDEYQGTTAEGRSHATATRDVINGSSATCMEGFVGALGGLFRRSGAGDNAASAFKANFFDPFDMSAFRGVAAGSPGVNATAAKAAATAATAAATAEALIARLKKQRESARERGRGEGAAIDRWLDRERATLGSFRAVAALLG